MEKVLKKTIKILVVLSLIFILFGVYPAAAGTATLYFSPSYGSFDVGSTFTVGIYVSSTAQAMNAASGVISFPKDKLEVISLSKTDSIINLWVQEPTFSSSDGTVSFEGIILNPAFTGSTGKILSATFKAKAGGDTSLSFSSGSVLANDGMGTNILDSLGTAQFSLNEPVSGPQAPAAETPSVVSGTPAAPKISSPTHPDPEKWYANKNPKFTWQVPSGTTAVRVLFDQKAHLRPSFVHSPPISEKELTDIDDGVWYFYVQLQNNNGWGGISRFQVQIDTQKPEHFEIKEVERTDLTEPKVKFSFAAGDATSGIEHFAVKIDEGDFENWQDNETHAYETPILAPGKHTLIVKAVDKAGNFSESSVEFGVQALDTPTFTGYPQELQSGEILVVKGKTYTNSQVTVWLQRENEDTKSKIIESDENGDFTFVAEEKIKDGVYKIWAMVEDQRGAKSNSSEELTIVVRKSAFLRIGSWAVSILSLLIPLLALVILLLLLIGYGCRKFSLFKRGLRKEVTEAELSLHGAFDSLRHNLAKQIKLLEKTKSKRELTKEEKLLFKQLKKQLDTAERAVGKEIGDIEKEVQKNTFPKRKIWEIISKKENKN